MPVPQKKLPLRFVTPYNHSVQVPCTGAAFWPLTGLPTTKTQFSSQGAERGGEGEIAPRDRKKHRTRNLPTVYPTSSLYEAEQERWEQTTRPNEPKKTKIDF